MLHEADAESGVPAESVTDSSAVWLMRLPPAIVVSPAVAAAVYYANQHHSSALTETLH